MARGISDSLQISGSSKDLGSKNGKSSRLLATEMRQGLKGKNKKSAFEI
jgi:hypothetical protein